MKINLDQPILDHLNKPIKDGEPRYKRFVNGAVMYDETGEPVVLAPAADFTLKTACFQALNSRLPGDEEMPEQEKLRIFMLTMKIAGATDEAHLTADDVSLLKKRAAKAFTPLVMGRCYQLLDPRSE